jgi:hypothetical protein
VLRVPGAPASAAAAAPAGEPVGLA